MQVIILFKRFCIILSVLLLIPNTVYANTEVNSISAYSSVVIDCDSKTILFEKNAYEKMSMASTTKIMTCLLACESKKLNENVVITREMLNNTEGSSIYLKVGDEITLLDLVKGAMLASGNDAANSIAVYLGGSVKNFIAKMNEKAKEIGMNCTHFVTPSGLDDKEHYSTAYDMSLLTAQALSNSLFREICCLKSADIVISSKVQTVYNHNKLLSGSKNFIGVKTGFTKKSGRCLVSAYKYKGNIIICVTLGAPDDWNDHKTLVNYAKCRYVRVRSNDNFDINTVGGEKNSVKCSSEYDVTTIGTVTTREYYYPFVYAPVKKGDIIGKQVIYSNNRIIKTVNIKATEGINIYGRQQSETTEIYG